MNSEPGFPMTAHRFSSLAALLAILIGLLVLSGWLFDITLLKSISPDWVTMKVNTAICFVLTGVALLLSAPLPVTVERSISFSLLAQFCSVLVFLIGVLTMSEYAFGWNFGIDQWLIQEPVGTPGTSHAGRMAPDTALCFSLLAAALWLSCSSFSKRWNIVTSVSLGLLVLTLTLTSITSYLLPAPGIFGWFGLTSMAIHTSILLAMLGIAVIATSWRKDILSWSLKSRLTFFTLFILLFSLWSLTFFASRMLYHDLQRQLSEQQLLSVSHMATDINDELNARLLALEDVAGTVSPTTLGNAEAIQAYLEGLAVVQRMFNGGIFATRIDGTATASIPLSAQRVGVNYMEKDHVNNALREGKSTVGRPVITRMLHSPVISMAVPIRNKQGETIGSLVGVTDLNAPNFLDRITEGKYGKTGGYVLVAARYRLVVTATDKNLIMQPLPPIGVNPMIDRYASGYEGSDILFNLDGKQVLNSVMSIPAAGWYVVVSLPTKEAFASIHAMQKRMLQAAIALAVLMVALTWWMLKRQMSPIFEAVETLADLSNSDQTPQPLPVAKMDEIGRLISGFNKLLKVLGQRESALRESEHRFRTIFNESPLGIALVDSLAGKIYSMNAMFAKIAGRSVEEMKQIDWMSITHPDDVQADMDNMALLNAGKIPGYHMEKRYIHHDGSHVWINMTVAPIYLEDKDSVCHLCMIEDISVRKAVEDQLRKLSLAVEQSSEIIVITDVNANIEYVNKAFVQETGYSREEVIGKNSRILHSGKTPAKTFAAMWNTLRQGLAWKGMFYNRKKDGTEYIEFAIITPMRQPDGSISSYVAVKEDITERKKLGEELDRHRYHLEELVSQRTKELLAARQQAEAANEAKSILLAVIGHEIRTPVNIIIKLSHLMREAGATPEQRARLDEIDSAGQHLLATINDIPDVDNTGLLKLENTDFSLPAILDDVRSAIGDAAHNKGVQVEVEADHRCLLGDRSRLSQALLNYASNILSFTQKGSSIILRARVLEENNNELLVRFEVTDTGIEPDRIERLSHIFDLTDTSRRAGESGSGQLATRRLAQLMGGEVGIDSTQQAGSTLWFTARLQHGQEIMAVTP